jgi:ATP dependent DNA ligase domain.
MTVYIREAMKACDADFEKIKFPVVVMPKIDGVRGYHNGEKFLARSGDPHPNRYTHEYFSDPLLAGIDCECVAERLTHPDLCRITTSALNTIETRPHIQVWCFDLVNDKTEGMTYLERLSYLERYVADLRWNSKFAHTIRCVPYAVCHTIEEVMVEVDKHKQSGYEGSILRFADGHYKFGRATAREATYLRVKAFADAEIKITSLEEGLHNANELTSDALGYAKRSTHKENMIPNGLIGAIYGSLLQDIVVNGKVKLHKGEIVKISPGRMNHDERKYYWENQDKVIGKIAKFQYFPHGMKDKLRFPTFISFRMPQDL